MTNVFQNPLQLGSLPLQNRVFLAPLAGVSDVPFRRICQELGAGLTYVEMLSATAIKYKSKRTFEMMARHKSEGVLGVQVTGSSAEDVAHAVQVLDAEGFDTIDINMGCPVRKVVGAGCGSAILKDPERISETVARARVATKRPLSAKIRLGYTRDTVNVTDTVSRVVSEHVDMFTIHGRTRSESYGTPCDLQGIYNGICATPEHKKQHVIKVGNGDVFGLPSALRMQAETQCDAVMVSRGALGNPWVFREIALGQVYQPTFLEWRDVVLRHISYQEEHFGNTNLAAVLLRKHLLWYAKGFPESKVMRSLFNQVASLQEARDALAVYATKVPAQWNRFAEASLSHDYDPKYEMDRVLDRGVGEDGL